MTYYLTRLRAAQQLLSQQAEINQLTTERNRYRIAWRGARTRALSTGSAADRYAARAQALQAALQEMLVPLFTGHVSEEHEPNAVAEIRAATLYAAADEIVAHCPEHGTAENSTAQCLCPAADLLVLRATGIAGGGDGRG
jgi:hypothetical protein